jgi:hypothetical protein
MNPGPLSPKIGFIPLEVSEWENDLLLEDITFETHFLKGKELY